MKNYHELARENKTSLKPVVSEIRKHLYGASRPDTKAALQEGLVINFGKGTEPRHTVEVRVVA